MQETLIALIIVGYIIYIANWVQTQKEKRENLIRIPLIGIAIFIILISIQIFTATVVGTESATENVFGDISFTNALILLILGVGLGGLSLLISVSQSIREKIQNLVVRSEDKERRYSAWSWVHTTAIVLAFAQFINVLMNYLLIGGIEGIAAQYAERELTIFQPLTDLTVYIMVSLLGVGLYIRRDLKAVLKRLGINNTTLRFLGIGALVGFILFWVQVSVTGVWTAIVSPESLAEQTSAAEAIFNAYSQSFLLALMLAITTGIGEELLFRGALQPIFGNVITSIFFALMHPQYLINPAIVLIFFVSLCFGWLRNRYNTTAAMMAHFVYNFMGFVIFFLAQSADVPLESFIP